MLGYVNSDSIRFSSDGTESEAICHIKNFQHHREGRQKIGGAGTLLNLEIIILKSKYHMERTMKFLIQKG